MVSPLRTTPEINNTEDQAIISAAYHSACVLGLCTSVLETKPDADKRNTELGTSPQSPGGENFIVPGSLCQMLFSPGNLALPPSYQNRMFIL
ncbi:hypothetical protein RRG08_019122 [Elysia crispata]|uniref:Uncharacterized protein n=1 Tax=Elysia crispata TaxID=231223 RepID=A0AAE1AZV9_9GAST|nr:hypothetical protein RRG08_019122 [Elysia crispata]